MLFNAYRKGLCRVHKKNLRHPVHERSCKIISVQGDRWRLPSNKASNRKCTPSSPDAVPIQQRRKWIRWKRSSTHGTTLEDGRNHRFRRSSHLLTLVEPACRMRTRRQSSLPAWAIPTGPAATLSNVKGILLGQTRIFSGTIKMIRISTECATSASGRIDRY